MKNNLFINEKRSHDSAKKHVSGYANYTDDIDEPNGTLYGAVGWSKEAHALIKKIDLKEVWNSEGVVTVITANDIPGRNDVGPVFDGDPIFPTQKIEFLKIKGGGGLEGPTKSLVYNAVENVQTIDAVYSMGGGNKSIISALEDQKLRPKIFIAHDLDKDNRELLIQRKIES